MLAFSVLQTANIAMVMLTPVENIVAAKHVLPISSLVALSLVGAFLSFMIRRKDNGLANALNGSAESRAGSTHTLGCETTGHYSSEHRLASGSSAIDF